MRISILSAVTSTAEAPYQPSSRRPIADRFRQTARGVVRFCVHADIHPDVVSYASIVASSIAALCLLFSWFHPWLLLIAPLFCYQRLWLNMLDGMVAVASGKASFRGEILNELPDRVSDTLIFAALAHSGWCHTALAYWAAICALLTAYVGMLGQAVGAKREFGGVMAKPARMVLLNVGAWTTLLLVWTGRGNGRVAGLSTLDWTCILIFAGCVQTIAVRLRSTFEILARKSNESAPFSVPSIAPPVHDGSEESFFTAADDAKIFYRSWLPRNPTKKAVLLFHRGHEHSGRWHQTVQGLDLGDDVAIFAWDQRGHGRSPGERGSAPNLAVVIKDADDFARHLSKTHGIAIEQMTVVAHSVGAVVASAWVHDYAPPLRGLVLATPAFRVKLYLPLAIPLLRLRQAIIGPGYVRSYVKSKMLTRDAREAAEYDADPAIFRQIAINILLDLFDTSTRLLDDAGAVTTPTLILGAGRDWVVKRSAQWKLYRRLSSPIKQFEVFEGSGHAIFHDVDREKVVARIRDFLIDCFDRPVPTRELLDADRGGFTRTEYDRLRSPGAMHWNLSRGVLRSVGRLSDGVRLGWDTGFDSGVTLDYVYENRPSGKNILGRLIDRSYLNSVGWRGIRARRQNLESLLREQMRVLHQSGFPVRIMDVACGAGRYVLETMKSLPNIPCSAILRDYQQINLDAAAKRAAELGVADCVQTQLGDAFDRESLAAVSPKPTIVIVSGLYELFPENDPLRRSLSGIFQALEPGGFLIYTCQPWHPQMEFIARVLTNREGDPWIMRRRTQREMDELVAEAGFQKIDQRIDPWGIFTVSVATR